MNDSTNIFTIRDIPTWQGLNWSVTWPGRGYIQSSEHIKVVWDTAFKTGAFSVGFALENHRLLRVDCVVREMSGDRALKHFLGRLTLLEGLAFAYRDEAEKFVYEMEKYITFQALKRKNNLEIFN